MGEESTWISIWLTKCISFQIVKKQSLFPMDSSSFFLSGLCFLILRSFPTSRGKSRISLVMTRVLFLCFWDFLSMNSNIVSLYVILVVLGMLLLCLWLATSWQLSRIAWHLNQSQNNHIPFFERFLLLDWALRFWNLSVSALYSCGIVCWTMCHLCAAIAVRFVEEDVCWWIVSWVPVLFHNSKAPQGTISDPVQIHVPCTDCLVVWSKYSRKCFSLSFWMNSGINPEMLFFWLMHCVSLILVVSSRLSRTLEQWNCTLFLSSPFQQCLSLRLMCRSFLSIRLFRMMMPQEFWTPSLYVSTFVNFWQNFPRVYLFWIPFRSWWPR